MPDSLHRQTVELYKKLVVDGCTFVTSSLVLVEVASALSARSSRHLAVELEQRIRSSDICQLVWIDQEIYERSWSLFGERLDKIGASLTV